MPKQKTIEYTSESKIEVLPDEINYTLEPFTPISAQATDEETTAADLQHLNNHLAMSAGMLPHVRTLAGMCMLSQSVCKLLEMRRHVKKLPFGQPKDGKGGKTFEVIE